jgi:hypothetical protein
MVDDDPTDNVPISKVEFRSSSDGLKISATPEAKLAALMKINANLSQALSLDEVLPKVLTSLFEIFPQADRGFVVMKDAAGNLIPRWVKTRRTRDETQTVRISRTIIREAMTSNTTILSLDASNDQRFDSSQSIADFSIKSMICAPLIDADGNAFGALQIDSTEGRGQFRDEDVDLLSGVAGQAAIVIRNAQLHERALQQQEVEQDLRLATEVQAAFLPQESPSVDGFHVHSFYRAAQYIGGDYFDYIPLPGCRCDVHGKVVGRNTLVPCGRPQHRASGRTFERSHELAEDRTVRDVPLDGHRSAQGRSADGQRGSHGARRLDCENERDLRTRRRRVRASDRDR